MAETLRNVMADMMLEKIKPMIAAGLTSSEIADKLGTSASNVRMFCAGRDVSLANDRKKGAARKGSHSIHMNAKGVMQTSITHRYLSQAGFSKGDRIAYRVDGNTIIGTKLSSSGE